MKVILSFLCLFSLITYSSCSLQKKQSEFTFSCDGTTIFTTTAIHDAFFSGNDNIIIRIDKSDSKDLAQALCKVKGKRVDLTVHGHLLARMSVATPWDEIGTLEIHPASFEQDLMFLKEAGVTVHAIIEEMNGKDDGQRTLKDYFNDSGKR